MNHNNYKAVGLDDQILKIQNLVASYFGDLSQIEIYGRVIKRQTSKKEKPVPMIQIGSDLKPVAYSDNLKCISFTVADDKSNAVKVGQMFTKNIKLVFVANLKKLFPEQTEFAFAEAEFLKEIHDLLNKSRLMKVDAIEYNAFTIFDGFVETEIFKKSNYPMITVAFVGPVHYYLNQTNF